MPYFFRSFSAYFFGLVHLMRPAEWTKSFGNMLMAVILGAFLYHINVDALLFLKGFISVALLWSALYTLNDYMDIEVDKLHPTKKLRPIPSGLIPPLHSIVFFLLLISSSFFLAFQINVFFALVLSLMTLNQFCYTLKPFEFKKRKIVDLISGSMVNPLLRFYAGWLLFIPFFNAPILILLFIVGLQFGGFTLYRLNSKTLETKLKYKSSVVRYETRDLQKASAMAIIISLLSFSLLFINFYLEILPSVLGFLPPQFLLTALSAFPFLKNYMNAVFNPLEADINVLYWQIYFNYLLFIILFIIVYYLTLYSFF